MAVFVTGDTHGDIDDTHTRIQWRLENFPPRTVDDNFIQSRDTVLIILGDFGGNFGGGRTEDDIKFKQMLEDMGITYFVIRGNHDQRPSNLFNGDTWHFEQMFDGPTYVENAFPHIHYAMDYPWVYNIEGNKTLVLPGANSVDKDWRLEYEKKLGVRLWFPDEQMTAAEREYVWTLCKLNDYKFDLILSHTCPWARIPKGGVNGWGNIDNTMEYLFDDIDQKVEYKSWFWGHHHIDHEYNYRGHHNACFSYLINRVDKTMEKGLHYWWEDKDYNKIFGAVEADGQ